MSILLDAVTRAKQQQLDDNLDPVLAPRMPSPVSAPWPWLRLLGGLGVLLLGVVSAWWYWQASAPGGASAQRVTVSPPPSNPSAGNKPATAEASVIVTPKADVRVAGRAALPIAQPLPVRTAEPSSALLASSQAVLPSTPVAATGQHQAVPADGQKTVSNQELNDGNAPIILGAKPNQRGLEVLQSLQQQTAAKHEVPSESTPAPQPVAADEQQALIAKFQAALSEVERRNALDNTAAPVTAAQPQYPSYGNLPASLQLQVPEFNIMAHMYATNPAKRWLNVDGQELREGDKIKGRLQIIEIRPRDVILDIQGTHFKVPAI
ncbi:general secretion pathway protein GspB [Shewanella sp. YIC-542]|uniref:general secretion pathway protein GspB n=1 Tax=Shewanella mytili TaxID=3377111 RepID=UPI00398F5A77